jgi:outer membrane protein assembly factor BamB
MEPYRDAPGPAEADRSVLVVGIDGYLVGIDRKTGEQRWENPLVVGGAEGEVFIALRYGALVVSAFDALVMRVDYLTGATLWERPTRDTGRATILVEPDLIVVGKGGYINAYDHNGRPLWFQELRGRGLGRLALAFPGNIAQADEAGLE